MCDHASIYNFFYFSVNIFYENPLDIIKGLNYVASDLVGSWIYLVVLKYKPRVCLINHLIYKAYIGNSDF